MNRYEKHMSSVKVGYPSGTIITVQEALDNIDIIPLPIYSNLRRRLDWLNSLSPGQKLELRADNSFLIRGDL